MPLRRVFKILSVFFLAALALGCGSGGDDNYFIYQTPASGTPARLEFQSVPQRAAGSTFARFSVAIVDKDGKVVTTDSRQVRIRLAEPTNGAILSGTTAVNAVNGVAVFTDLSVDKVGTYTFIAEADGLESAESTVINITPGGAAQISFLQAPPAAPASLAELNPPVNAIIKGTPITPPVTVQVLDAFGNPAPDGTSVTIVPGLDPTGTTTLSGDRVTTVNGVATFDNLIVETGGGITVFAAAVSGDVVAIASPSFVVADGYVYAVVPLVGQNLVRAKVFPPAAFSLEFVGGTGLGFGVIGNIDFPPGSFSKVTGLVNHPTGDLYATANLTAGGGLVLLRLNPLATGTDPNLISVTPITGTNTGTSVTGMTMNPSTGAVYIFVEDGTSSGLYTLNINSGAATFVGGPGGSFTVGNALAWDPFANNGEGALFTSGGIGTVSGLSLLDPATGAATEIPGTSSNLTDTVWDLTVNPLDTSLVGVLDDGTDTRFTRIDKTTGEEVPQPPLLPYTLLHPIGGTSITGLRVLITPYIQEPIPAP